MPKTFCSNRFRILAFLILLFTGTGLWAHANSVSRLVLDKLPDEGLLDLSYHYRLVYFVKEHDMFVAVNKDFQPRKSFSDEDFSKFRDTILNTAIDTVKYADDKEIFKCLKESPEILWIKEKKLFKIKWKVRCPAKISSLDVRLPLIMEPVHSTYFMYKLGEKVDYSVLNPYKTTVILKGDASKGSLAGFIFIGAEHILGGLDHVLYVLLLTLAARNFFQLVKALSYFTIGHSITLIAAGYSQTEFIPGGIVETMIALSIFYLAVILYLQKPISWSVGTALFFGLFHGLGFISALGTIEAEKILFKVLLFNVGVEIGQIMIAIPAFYLILAALKKYKREKIVKISTVPCGLLALFWAFERLAGYFGIL